MSLNQSLMRFERLFAPARRCECGDPAQESWIPACAGMSGENHAVMLGRSRPKDGIVSLAYVQGIHALLYCRMRDGWVYLKSRS